MHVVKVMHFTYIARKPSIAMNELPKTPEGALRALNYPCMEFIDCGRLSPLQGAQRLPGGIRARLAECRHKETPYRGSVGRFCDYRLDALKVFNKRSRTSSGATSKHVGEGMGHTYSSYGWVGQGFSLTVTLKPTPRG